MLSLLLSAGALGLCNPAQVLGCDLAARTADCDYDFVRANAIQISMLPPKVRVDSTGPCSEKLRPRPRFAISLNGLVIQTIVYHEAAGFLRRWGTRFVRFGSLFGLLFAVLDSRSTGDRSLTQYYLNEGAAEFLKLPPEQAAFYRQQSPELEHRISERATQLLELSAQQPAPPPPAL